MTWWPDKHAVNTRVPWIRSRPIPRRDISTVRRDLAECRQTEPGAHIGGYRTSALSRPSQRVTVAAVTGHAVTPRLASCGDRRPGLSQGAETNNSAHHQA